MAEVKPRTYHSPRRREQARQTRDAILTAARDRFLERGYNATTIDEIAAAAGVSKPTVFTAVGSKTQLLKVVRDIAMAGDDDPAPVAERPSVERARDAHTAEEALRLVAAHIASLSGRYARIDEVLRGAAATGEPELAELWETSERQRRIGAGILLGIVRGKGPLRSGLDPHHGEDILSNYMASDIYLRLVHRLGWSAEEFQRWLEITLAWQLLGIGLPSVHEKDLAA
jgi:AcrR family transcriptional regulator